jgi:hypothetical protein
MIFPTAACIRGEEHYLCLCTASGISSCNRGSRRAVGLPLSCLSCFSEACLSHFPSFSLTSLPLLPLLSPSLSFWPSLCSGFAFVSNDSAGIFRSPSLPVFLFLVNVLLLKCDLGLLIHQHCNTTHANLCHNICPHTIQKYTPGHLCIHMKAFICMCICMYV